MQNSFTFLHIKKAVFFITLLFSLALLPALSPDDYGQILLDIDNLQNFGDKDFTAKYTIISKKTDEENELLEVQLFRRDVEDLFLMIIILPKVQYGQGFLQLEDNLWFYDPESRKFEHSSAKENIQNSDAKNNDLMVQTLSQDYTVVSHEEGVLGKENVPVYILNLEAKNDEVSYPKMKLWVRQNPTIPMRSEEYGYSGRLMRQSAYGKYVKVGEKYLPMAIRMDDMLNVGEITVITMKDPWIGSIPDSIFTKAYLEKVSK